MNSLVREFFTAGEGGIEEVFFLEEKRDLGWEEASQLCPALPRGWYELSRLISEDRIEFARDFWLSKLPFQPSVHAWIEEFFGTLDDVNVVLVRKKKEELFSPELVYSLNENRSFFRGKPAAAEEDLFRLQEEIPFPIPRDYLSFAKIHNGFGKLSEMGLLKVEKVPDARRKLIRDFIEKDLTSGDLPVDLGSLVPFYESSGLLSYQCFYADWYPGSEMGNVNVSMIDHTISDTSDPKIGMEEKAFPSFLDWLGRFLEGMSVE